MKIFETSKWIWFENGGADDEYGEFFTKFNASKSGGVRFRISCDGDYVLYVNGKYAASNQYGDFEHYKVYDELDLAELVHEGENTVSILVWHIGRNSSRYASAPAGLIFEAEADGAVIAASGADTLARKSPAYESGRCKLITGQLGFGFAYDENGNDGSFFDGRGFGKAVVTDKSCVFYPRPCKKLELADKEREASVTESDGGRHYLIDLMGETVGLLTLRLYSEHIQKIKICWGEHLEGGHVKQIIGARDFSIEYTARVGKNDYTNYMLRFGCRYIELFASEPIKLEYAGLIPQYYPVLAKEASLDGELDRRIYALCVNTLKLSMMEHYVDCPWREQSFYAFDSRNQMLSGYYVFENGNAEYARACLKLISMDRRRDGLLSICYPTGKDYAIPSFSLHYVIAVAEYCEHTGDKEFVKDVYGKIISVLNTFRQNKRDGLVCGFGDKVHWNFYDWSEYLDGEDKSADATLPDSVINLLYATALDKFKEVCAFAGCEFPYADESDKIRESVTASFFNGEDGLFSLHKGKRDYTELANSLAVISGAASGERARRICERLTDGSVTESSLSMKCFMYDALIMTDEKKYAETVLAEIRKNYGHMLDCGATAAWETIKGAEDFDGAGSLCHGWSAIPIYYYNKFNMVKIKK